MPEPEHPHEIIYFVNGEQETITQHELEVRVILETAGFTPAIDYTLKSENPPHDYSNNYDQKVKLHPQQHFQAQFKGPTPTS